MCRLFSCSKLWELCKLLLKAVKFASLRNVRQHRLCLKLDSKQQLCYKQQLVCRDYSAKSMTATNYVCVNPSDHHFDKHFLWLVCVHFNAGLRI